MESVANRPRRADAERNRRRLLDAAAAVFAEHGIDAGVAEIARRAGVGQGTLFRHFPAKEDLVAAIAIERIQESAALVRELLGDPAQEDPLLAFLERIVEMHSRDRTLFEAVGCGAALRPDMHAAKEEMERALAALVQAGKRAGQIRDDVSGPDVMMLVHGVLAALEPFQAVAPRLGRRYAVLARDALRPEGASRLPGRPPTAAERDAALAAMG